MYICMCILYVQDSTQVKEALGLLELDLKTVATAPYRFWTLNQGPMKEQKVFLTTEQSLQY